MSVNRFLNSLILIFLISSCAAPSVQYAEVGKVLEIERDVDSIPLALSKILIKLRRLETLRRKRVPTKLIEFLK